MEFKVQNRILYNFELSLNVDLLLNVDVMSDSGDDFESEEESGEDFSASEDDWQPGKDDALSLSEEDESDDHGEIGSDDEESPVKKVGKGKSKG